MLNFLNIRGQGVDFQNFKFFSKIEPLPQGEGSKIYGTLVTLKNFLIQPNRHIQRQACIKGNDRIY